MTEEIADKINFGGVGVLPTDTLYGLSGSALSPAVVERIYELKQRPAELPFIVLIGGWEDLGKLGIEITGADRAVLEKNWPAFAQGFAGHSSNPAVIARSLYSSDEAISTQIATPSGTRARNDNSESRAISFVFPCPDPENKFEYLHRGKRTLAVRWPVAVGTAMKNEKLKIKNGNTNTDLDSRRSLPSATIGGGNDIMQDFNLSELLRQTGPLIATSANESGRPAATTIEEARDYFGDQVDFYLDGGPRAGRPSTLVKLTDGKVEIIRQGETIIKN